MIIVASKNLGFLGGMPFNAPTIITETSNRPGTANSVKIATNHTHERQTSASPWSFKGCRIFLILPNISPGSSTSPIKSLLRGNLVPAHSPSFRSHPRSSGSLQLVHKMVNFLMRVELVRYPTYCQSFAPLKILLDLILLFWL